jgi:subfamily B ATP-binding cassette protein MsbA
MQNETFHNIKKLIIFLKLGKVNMWFFILTVTLSLCFTLMAMYGALLLFPLSEGIIKGDFSSTQNIWGVAFIARHLPIVVNTSTGFFIILVIWIYLVTILKNIFHYSLLLSTQIQSKLATERIRQLLVNKCLSFSKEFYDKNTISYLQSIFNKSVTLFESQFGLFQNFISQILLMIAYIVIMISISLKLTLISVLFFPFINFLIQLLIQRIRKASIKHKSLSIALNERIFNLLYCMPIIKSFGKEQYEIEKFIKASLKEIDESFKIQRMLNLILPLQDMAMMTGVLFVAFGMGSIIHSDHSFVASKAFVFFYLLIKITSGFNAYSQFKIGLVKTAEALHDIENILFYNESYKIISGNYKFTGLMKNIQFKDLSFSYTQEGGIVLQNVNFTIEKGAIVAIVGPSGSGKTTLINLLLRFYDCPPGSILIDNKDIKEYDISTLRKHMAFVSQEALLFNDTIKNNILYGSLEEISDEHLYNLTEKVQINDFVTRMSHKFETSIGERGGRLSAGERQRLSIARAIIRDPEILIMDEATSSLDSETEEKISRFLSSISKDKTLIIIAHRLSTIKKADKIIHIDKGCVIESGTLEELITKNGEFYKLWQAQKI